MYEQVQLVPCGHVSPGVSGQRNIQLQDVTQEVGSLLTRVCVGLCLSSTHPLFKNLLLLGATGAELTGTLHGTLLHTRVRPSTLTPATLFVFFNFLTLTTESEPILLPTRRSASGSIPFFGAGTFQSQLWSSVGRPCRRLVTFLER